MPKQAKVYWGAMGTDSIRHYGEMPSIEEGASLVELETNLFKEMNKNGDISFGYRVAFPDGSGLKKEYVKRGEVWVQTFADRLEPDWFALIFLGMIGAFLLVLLILGLTGVIR